MKKASLRFALILATGILASISAPAAWAASSWSTPLDVDGTAPLSSISCASASFCGAVDANGNVIGYNGSTWSLPFNIDSSGHGLSSISCVASLFCAAVDGSGNAYTWTWTHGGVPQGVVTTNISNDGLSSVSCASGPFCVAVNQWAATYDGSSWTHTGPTSTPLGSGGFDSVSCPSSSFCAAVDTNGDAVTYNGSSWSSDTTIDNTSLPMLTSVSCSSSSFCMAVDVGGNAFMYNGSVWSGANPIDPGGSGLASVSCPSSSFCVAVDGANDALVWNGSGWSAPTTIDPGGVGLTSVSCPSSSFCAAVDGHGNVILYPASSTPPPSRQYTLTVFGAGTGSGSVSASGISCPGVCSHSYSAGSAVTLSARPRSGSSFSGWSGACHGTGRCTVTMNSNLSVSATFTRTGAGGGVGTCVGNCGPVTVFGGGGVGVISAPPSNTCVSSGTLSIQINSFHSVTYKQITVYVNKKRVKLLKGHRHKTKIVLHKLKRRKITIKVIVNSTRWTVTGTRSYEGCS